MFFKVLKFTKFLLKYKVRFIFMMIVGLGYGFVNTSLAGTAGFLMKLINPEIPADNATSLIPKSIVHNDVFQWFMQIYPEIVTKQSLFYISLIMFLILVVALSIAIFFQNYLGQWLSAKVTVDLREELAEHLLELDLSYYVQSEKGYLIFMMSNNIGAISAILNMLAILLTRPIALLVSLFYVFYINWQLAICGLIGVPIASIVLRRLSKKIRWTTINSLIKGGDVTTSVLRFMNGIATVKSFNCEKFELDNLRKHNRELFYYQAKQLRAKCGERPVSSLTSKLGIFLVLYLGGNMVLDGELAFDSVVAFIAALSLMYAPAKELSKLNAEMQANLPGAEAVINLLQQESNIKEGDKVLDEFKDKIEFKNVNFRYQENEPVIKDFSLNIHKGETVALVGASGSGKTTIVNLILRLFDIVDGSVEIDGINIKDLTFRSLREKISIVGQTPYLFSCTIAENISYGRDDVVREDVINAAKAANIHNEIMSLPNGYDTVVMEGGDNFSGGQKQRISIARALFKNSPILLLDEATSALDSVNEKQVQGSIDVLMKGRTSVVVAHRLSTIKNADKIVMMSEGRIIGIGKHKELIVSCPEYANLVQLQGL